MKKITFLRHLMIIFLLIGCEKTIEPVSLPVDSFRQFRNSLKEENIQKLIPHNFEIDWKNPLIGYSEDFGSDYYEFPIEWTDNNNPEELSLTRKRYGVKLEYKLVAVPKDGSFDFFVAKLEGSSNSLNGEMSLTLLDQFDGIYWQYNLSQEIISAKQYVDGSYIGIILIDEKNREFSAGKLDALTCYDIVYEIVTDYYNIRGDGSLEYGGSSSRYESIEVCGGGGGGGSGGSWGGTGTGTGGGSSGGGSSGVGTPSNDCGGCNPIIFKDVILPPPSCKSFDYHQGINNNQTAAVKNISFKVAYFDNTGEVRTSDVLFTQPIYFTIPRYHATEGNLTGGRGRELSAKALLNAHSRATAYFLATNGSNSQVRAKLWEYIRDEFRNGSYLNGGSASFTPPLGGFNGPVKYYITSFIGMDNCD